MLVNCLPLTILLLEDARGAGIHLLAIDLHDVEAPHNGDVVAHDRLQFLEVELKAVAHLVDAPLADLAHGIDAFVGQRRIVFE